MMNKLIEKALYIRAFEETLHELFRRNFISGTIHTCIGQEMAAVCLYHNLNKELDIVFSNHRCHGHYLAFGGTAEELLTEMMGRNGAICKGRGGSQHIWRNHFFSNGIQAGFTAAAVGYAWAIKLQKKRSVVVCHIGDGTLGEGLLYEAFSFSVLLEVPILFVLEDNGIAQSTITKQTLTGSVKDRVEAFGLAYIETDDLEPEKIVQTASEAIDLARNFKPGLFHIKTRRLCAHSKGDDTRSTEELSELWAKDILSTKINNNPEFNQVYQKFKADIIRLSGQISRQEYAVYESKAIPEPPPKNYTDCAISTKDKKYRQGELLNQALKEILSADDKVVILGEDIADPYGGAFKITKGISSLYNQRVFSTPIAEAAIIGTANGLALAGMRPVAEIMFADFTTLCADQIINQSAKYYYMYGGNVKCPITIRIPSGGYRGYGPTHSQSMESLFTGIPGLRVLALSRRHNPAMLLEKAICDNAPVLFFENKTDYPDYILTTPPAGMKQSVAQKSDTPYSPICFCPLDDLKADITLVTYGGAVKLLERAIEVLLIEYEILCDYFILTQLSPLRFQSIFESVKQTRCLVAVEEGFCRGGVGDELISEISQAFNRVSTGLVRPHFVPIPTARHLEKQVLPSVENIVDSVRKTIAKVDKN